MRGRRGEVEREEREGEESGSRGGGPREVIHTGAGRFYVAENASSALFSLTAVPFGNIFLNPDLQTDAESNGKMG